jgi:hypothetical protein
MKHVSDWRFMKIRKSYKFIGFTLVILVGSVMTMIYLSDLRQTRSFGAWQTENPRQTTAFSDEVRVHSVVSQPLAIKGISRSMQGPYEVQPVNDLLNGSNELVWLTDYKASIYDDKGNPLPNGFMCHNNLNIVDKRESPWEIKTHGSNIRLFTLTEGQTELHLPNGFGIPIMASTKLEVVAQVLNHNDPNANITSEHRTEIGYVRDSEAKTDMIPLYLQSVFITKQTDGPIGMEGSALLCNAYDIDSIAAGNNPNHGDNSRQLPYNPYLDAEGRNYTGHWELPKGRESLITDVTRMLNLNFDTRIHYISAHLHPFAESMMLIDATTGDTLHTIHSLNHPDRIGLATIETFASVEGIPVFKDHKYAAVSTYNCPEDKVHTAMATLFLYLRDN